MKTIKYYYFDLLKEFRSKMPSSDTLYPAIAKIQDAVQFASNPTFQKMMQQKEGAEKYMTSDPGRNAQLYSYFNSEDME